MKEPSTLLFFKGAIYEFTHNKDGVYSQGQMALLFDLPDEETIQRNGKVKVLAAPTGLHDIEYNENKRKEEYFASGFSEVEIGLAPNRTQSVNRYKQAQRTQYGLRHRVTSTIHAAMGDTLSKVAIQITDSMFELWDKAQVIVFLTRTKVGKNVILVRNKEETIEAIVRLVQSRSQWTDYMENILKLITINDNPGNASIPTLTQNNFPYRICDVSLPQCKTGFVYFLISVRTRDYTYIGECNCIISRLYQHNSGYGSTSTTPINRRPFAIIGYICGFNGDNRDLRREIERKWKEKRDYLITEGIDDTRTWVRSGKNVISELDSNMYQKEISELRLVELFK